MNVSELSRLIYERQKEWVALNETLGTDFPVVEDNKRRRMAYLEMLIEDLRSLKDKETTLNENQKDLVIWMQDNERYTDDPLESISDLFLEGTPSEYFPDAPLSCVEAAYQSLNKKQKLELVQEYVKKALEQEEE